METSSDVGESVWSESRRVILDNERENDIDLSTESEVAMESVEEKVGSVGHRMKRSPLPGDGLDLITDFVKTGKDISMAGGI